MLFPLQKKSKRLDFGRKLPFYKAILIKEERGKNLTDIEKDKIFSLKNSINRNRETTQSMDSGNNGFVINSNWLVGFIEGDGTFGIKNSSPYLQIAQKTLVKTLNYEEYHW